MLLAVLSDIHANLEALEAVLKDCSSRNTDKIFCLGDVVGYGADPGPCLDLVMQRCSVTVLGNHDAALLDPAVAEGFSEDAAVSIQWTSGQVREDHRAWLAALPLRYDSDGFSLTHASFDRPDAWTYVWNETESRLAFEGFRTAVGFIGHTHVASFTILHEQGDLYDHPDAVLELEKNNRFLVNAGSVGQPREGDRRAAYALMDNEQKTVEIVRVQYDRDTAADKILKAGLPSRLAARLRA